MKYIKIFYNRINSTAPYVLRGSFLKSKIATYKGEEKKFHCIVFNGTGTGVEQFYEKGEDNCCYLSREYGYAWKELEIDSKTDRLITRTFWCISNLAFCWTNWSFVEKP